MPRDEDNAVYKALVACGGKEWGERAYDYVCHAQILGYDSAREWGPEDQAEAAALEHDREHGRTSA